MTLEEVLVELEGYGNPNTKKTLAKHGAKEPFFGVKVADLKKIIKKIKKDQALAEELYATGNSDAMYLAGLIADEKTITKATIQKWMKGAYWYYLSEYTVPWIAADSQYGWELALEWIESDKETIAAGGWGTLSSLIMTKPDEALDLKMLKKLLKRVEKDIHKMENRVKYTMNGFVIAVGGGIVSLSKDAIQVANKIGEVKVDMNGTACKVPIAEPYIQKMINMGRLGRKKKMARC